MADYGSYQSIIDTLQQQQQQLGGIYQPQVQALQSKLPTIQSQYQALLDQLTQQTQQQQQRLGAQEKSTLGQEQVRSAAAGVASAYGTPEMAAQQQIKGSYQQAIADLLAQTGAQAGQYKFQQQAAEQDIQSQIANILAQQQQAQMDISSRISEAQAQAAAAAEEKRRWEAEFAASQAAARRSSGGGGGGGSSVDYGSELQKDVKDALMYYENKKITPPPGFLENRLIPQLQKKYTKYGISSEDISNLVNQMKQGLVSFE